MPRVQLIVANETAASSTCGVVTGHTSMLNPAITAWILALTLQRPEP